MPYREAAIPAWLQQWQRWCRHCEYGWLVDEGIWCAAVPHYLGEHLYWRRL